MATDGFACAISDAAQQSIAPTSIISCFVFIIIVVYVSIYNSVTARFGSRQIKKLTEYSSMSFVSAVRTRLELVTSCVTGRHSNQLN